MVWESINLPEYAQPVNDVDEEIFLIWTAKESARSDLAKNLGYYDVKASVVSLSFSVARPQYRKLVLDEAVKAKGKGKPGGGLLRAVTPGKDSLEVEVELSQDLEMLRHRRGDTGSVLWRVSLYIGKLLLSQAFYPPASPLFPSLRTSRVLELGSGTGFLGILLAPIVAEFTFTDQPHNLPLVVRNAKKYISSPKVEEVDWVVEEQEWDRRQTPRSLEGQDGAFPDLILACDCIFNAALSAPLAKTLTALSGPRTIALVAVELRDSEAVSVFLAEWLALGWTVVRLTEDDQIGKDEGIPELGSGLFGVWLGQRCP